MEKNRIKFLQKLCYGCNIREILFTSSTIFYLPGTGLSLAAGAVFGWTFGQEFANHYLQLYRMDTLAAQSKFMEWWEAKCAERS